MVGGDFFGHGDGDQVADSDYYKESAEEGEGGGGSFESEGFRL